MMVSCSRQHPPQHTTGFKDLWKKGSAMSRQRKDASRQPVQLETGLLRQLDQLARQHQELFPLPVLVERGELVPVEMGTFF